jgi:diguanylate cyclase (GGDEF)-like protein
VKLVGPKRLVQIVADHPWSSLRDFLLLSGFMAFAVLMAQRYDIFAFIVALADPQRGISPAEGVLLACLAVGCVGVFIDRRLDEAHNDGAQQTVVDFEMHALRELAMQDPLTGLPNRRALQLALEAALQRPPLDGRAHAFFLLDLNGFKSVNDLYGHSVGDRVLQAVVDRFRRVARTEDLIARLGGDEFAVLACNVDRAAAGVIGGRYISALHNEVRTEGCSHAVGVAIGAALFPGDGDTVEKILRHADVAMYRAKSEAVSSLVFFDHSAHVSGMPVKALG